MVGQEAFRPVFADLVRLDARFARLDAEQEAGCWLWTGCVNWSGRRRTAAYGRIKRLSQSKRPAAFVHRYVWELIWGRIEDGYEVHHECGATLCCNPNHLSLRWAEDHRRFHGYRRNR